MILTKETWKEVFLMHSDTLLFKKTLKRAKECISIALSVFKKPYVAYSGGKDSCVLLHLVLNLKKDIKVIHWDYGSYYMPRSIETELLKNAIKMGGLNLETLTSPLYSKKKRQKANIWYREFLGKELPRLAHEGFDCSFIGLRAEESSSRKRRTKSFFSHDGHMVNCFPLRNFTYKDIYAYLLKHEVPYLAEHYNKYSALLGYAHSRFVTFFDPEFNKLGSSNVDGVLMHEYKYSIEDVPKKKNA